MSALFHSLIYQPIYNFLVLLYQIIPGSDFGIAIIVATIALKSLLYPLSQKQIESQKKLQEIQPKIKEIQKKYKGDREKQSRAVMEFYRENKVNPFSGCLPLIIQLVILIAIYRVLFSISNSGFVASSEVLYSFISNPGNIHQLFLGILDLSKPSTILAVATALALPVALVSLVIAFAVMTPEDDAPNAGFPKLNVAAAAPGLFAFPLRRNLSFAVVPSVESTRSATVSRNAVGWVTAIYLAPSG